ncbi:MAG TPA: hypothetical protein PLR64_03660 [Candidatus Dojkabacteria bacterium]|nr:hypothetical protein [Candidatus Dojkabacteria bacterium]
METTFKSISEIIDQNIDCPIPIRVIPDNMGINLVAVDSICWQRQDDGQLVSITIYFKPESKK